MASLRNGLRTSVNADGIHAAADGRAMSGGKPDGPHERPAGRRFGFIANLAANGLLGVVITACQ